VLLTISCFDFDKQQTITFTARINKKLREITNDVATEETPGLY
jgi:hypothetical protein